VLTKGKFRGWAPGRNLKKTMSLGQQRTHPPRTMCSRPILVARTLAQCCAPTQVEISIMSALPAYSHSMYAFTEFILTIQ
jgi:hypothetical protein